MRDEKDIRKKLHQVQEAIQLIKKRKDSIGYHYFDLKGAELGLKYALNEGELNYSYTNDQN